MSYLDVNDVADHIEKNYIRHSTITVDDSSISPYDLRSVLIDKYPHHLYEMRYVDEGELIDINNGECIIYAGRASYSDAAKNASLIIDSYQVGGKSMASPGGFMRMLTLLVAAFIVAIIVILLFVV